MKQIFYHQKQFRLLTKRTLLLLLSFIFMSAIYAQEKTVTGTIVDKSGVPLPGVNVVIKGTTNGTVTDLEGKYSIKVPDNNTVLSITYVGYTKQEIKVEEQAIIKVVLEEEVKELNEVVVVGYGTQKKSDLTGAIASVSAEQLTKIPVSGLDQALQGRAAGVNIIQNSGMPGGGTSIQIRGISSINGTSPLVIVDGVTGSLSGLNPNDIESIEVLKDASSEAIYGASGGNGVILITTKKGKAGKLVSSFDYYLGWQTPWKEMPMENSQQWGQTQNWINMIRHPDTYVPLVNPDTLKNYDWQKIMFHTAIQKNYNFSISGGNERSTFMASVSYLDQEGILHNSDYTHFTARINSVHKLSKIITVGENVQFDNPNNNGYQASYTYNGQGEAIFNNAFNSPIPGILTMYPFLPAYDNQGNWSKSPSGFTTYNPKVNEDVMNQQEHGYNTGGNAYVDLNLFKGFTFTSKGSGYMNFTVLDGFNEVYNYSQSQENPKDDNVTKEYKQTFGWQWQNYANYTTKIMTDHTIGLLAGIDASYSKDVNMQGTRYDLLNETSQMRYFNASTNDSLASQIVTGGASERSQYAYFGRFSYDYKDKYLITANLRQDWSSKFGPGFRSGNFPSFSLGWKFSDEDFVKNSLSFLSFGKIRYGWGKTGANSPDDYSYFSSVNASLAVFKASLDHSNTPYYGAAPVIIANKQIHWEAMVSNNLGMDLAFMHDQLSVSIDYFNRYNDGMIIHVSEPSFAGIYQNPNYTYQEGGDSRPLVNAGKISNKGIEVTIGYKLKMGDLKSSFDFNFSYTKNKVENLQGDSLADGNVGVNLSNVTLTKVGSPISQFYGFKTDGIFRESDLGYLKGKQVILKNNFTINSTGDTTLIQPTARPGDIRFVDLNHNGKIDAGDKTFIGSPLPDFVYGFSINLEYKGFDFLAFFQGTFGNKIFNGSKLALMNQDIGSNRLAVVYNQYRSPLYNSSGVLIDPGNTNTDLFRLDPKGTNQNLTRVSDFYVEDGSYLRLKNIQLGYTIPQSLTQKVGIDNLRVYIGAKNLLTFTKYTGFDPEVGPTSSLVYGLDAGGNYPQAKMFLFGVNLKF